MGFKLTSLFLIVLFIFIIDCQQINKKDVEQGLIGLSNYSKIDFENDFYNFGNVNSGEKITCSFIFKNTGNSELIIFDVVPGCGCAIPEYDKTSILPGKKGKIVVHYNTQGKRGSTYFEVLVKSNAVNPIKTITLKANIIFNNN